MGQAGSRKPGSRVPVSQRSAVSVELPSSGAPQGDGGGPMKRSYVFVLVNVDQAVLKHTSVGESVGLRYSGGVWQVLTVNGRLGDVPPRYEQRVARLESKTGSVERIDGSRVTVRVGE